MAGLPTCPRGVGGNLTARNLPDMLGDKIGMKWDPAGALKDPASTEP